MLAALRQRNFALLWFGQLISLLGDWVLFVALPFYIYTLTGSTLATGVMFIVQTLPRLLLGSVAGVFVDRWNRRRTMYVADLLQALVLLPLLLVHSSQWVWIIYVFAFVESCVSQFFLPAKGAIIPQLVDEEHLVAANALNSSSEQVTRLVGPVLGGALFGLFSINGVALADSASFLISALMIILIALPRTGTQEEKFPITGSLATAEVTAITFEAVWHEWLQGLALVRKERLIVAIFAAMGAAMIGEGLIEVLIVPFVKGVMHGNAEVLGWILTAQAIGGIAGSFLLNSVSKKIQPRLLVASSAFALGIILFIIINFPLLGLVLALLALAGLPVIGFYINLYTLLQVHVEDKYRGRIFGAYMTAQALMMLVGMGLASGLGDRIGIIPMMDVDAVVNILAGVIAFVLMSGTVLTKPTEPVPGDVVAQESALS
ncbi:MAG TPA: MFS transporter [Ktedonobacteraceae bacterium]|nr:MFS transporter [Ktedonobacteraceae bacterium]